MFVRSVVLVIAGALLPAAGAAAATAAPTCQGEEATIVAGPHDEAVGTPGRDVVVSDAARSLDLGPGDDLVCIVRLAVTHETLVDAGPGDDTIDASAAGMGTTNALLREGDDTFVGGPGTDRVNDSDLGINDVSTGAGDDEVTMYDSVVMDDRIVLGDGDDAVVVAVEEGMSPEGLLEGGDGRDQASFYPHGHDLVLDNVAERLTGDGALAMAWTGLEAFTVLAFGSDVDIVGSARSEWFRVFGGLRAASLGGGDDVLQTTPTSLPQDAMAVLDAGLGRDLLHLFTDAPRLTLDLRGDVLADPANGRTTRVPGFEDGRASGRRLTLVGDAGPNHLVGTGCGATVRGNGGSDVLTVKRVFRSAGSGCRPTTLNGQAGNDRLFGDRHPDVLVGGKGSDLANGRDGRDSCVSVERAINCEEERH